MGYAGEKLILAIVFSLIGVFLNKKRVEINRRFKALIVMTCLMAVVITYSYFHSYCPEVTFPYWLRFIFVVLFLVYVLMLTMFWNCVNIYRKLEYLLQWYILWHGQLWDVMREYIWITSIQLRLYHFLQLLQSRNYLVKIVMFLENWLI